MINVIFKNNDRETNIQCNKEEKMEDIIKRYKKIVEIKNEYYLYNELRIDKELKLEEIIKKSDNKIIILVCNNSIEENNKIISKNMICPECNDDVIVDINDYIIEKKCKNNHNNKTLIKNCNNEIDISKIKCKKCNKNKSELNNNELFLCINCNINLCTLCLSNHDKNHININLDDKNVMCGQHKKFYSKFCCNKNICIDCENEHNGHNI